ncbi:hypothetical protein LEM8419_01507 [Neolewinella maritima]|uniref:Uncharacterized protein n=1 Tax=Neolewinella maritima TaxID=1383882 RepID=A0ABN8F869_9BACT|nr:hypothetical protein [Neolewinella maritima]CAH1000354.1 hypothetical protein LEM8419_01507 [Neolewinella maritima]
MLDAAYALLGNVLVDADLTIDAPGGGRIRLTHSPSDDRVLLVQCSDESALLDTFQLASQLGLVQFNPRALRQLRNPLLQQVDIVVNDKLLLRWPSNKLPQVKSLRGVLKLIRQRRG